VDVRGRRGREELAVSEGPAFPGELEVGEASGPLAAGMTTPTKMAADIAMITAITTITAATMITMITMTPAMAGVRAVNTNNEQAGGASLVEDDVTAITSSRNGGVRWGEP
jgi:hypothetical protein